MTIQQLQYVLEIARCGSASRAAKNLFLSQPNLSSAITNLEQELGFPIFERTSAGMELTPAGSVWSIPCITRPLRLSGIFAGITRDTTR